MKVILEAMPFEFAAGEAEGEMRRPPARRATAPARARAPVRTPVRTPTRAQAPVRAPAPARAPMRSTTPQAAFSATRQRARPVLRAGATRINILPVAMPYPGMFQNNIDNAPSYAANNAQNYPAYPDVPAPAIQAEPFPASALEPSDAAMGMDAGPVDGADVADAAAVDGAIDGATDGASDGADAGQGEYAAFSPYFVARRYPQPRPASLGNPYIRWVQHRLNQILGTSMRKSGVLDAAARNGLLRFQRIYGLRVTGMLDAATRNALRSPPSRGIYRPYVRPAYLAGQARGVQAEIPTAIKNLIASGPAGTYPKYSNGPVPLQNIGAVPGLNVPGLYLITFNLKGQRRAYSGMSDNLHTRLTQHFRCLSFTGELERQYDVYYEKIPFPAGVPKTKANFAAHMQKVRDMEKALNSQRASLGGSLVNRTTELESAPFQF